MPSQINASAAAEHAHAVRPLRARDRRYFGALPCSALAAADAQLVRPRYQTPRGIETSCSALFGSIIFAIHESNTDHA